MDGLVFVDSNVLVMLAHPVASPRVHAGTRVSTSSQQTNIDVNFPS